MKKDTSRRKALEFLLSRQANLLFLNGQIGKDQKESLQTLEIAEGESEWLVSLTLDGVSRAVNVNKSDFIFYPVKNENSYPEDPLVKNERSARIVLKDLLEMKQVGNTQIQKKVSSAANTFYTALLVFLFVLSSQYSLVTQYVFVFFQILFFLIFVYSRQLHRSFLVAKSALVYTVLLILAVSANQEYDLRLIGGLLASQLVGDLFLFTGSKMMPRPRIVLFFAIFLSLIAWLLFDSYSANFYSVAKEITAFLGILLINLTCVFRNFTARMSLIVGAGCLVISVMFTIIIDPKSVLILPLSFFILFYSLLYGDSRNPMRVIVPFLFFLS